MTGKDIIKITLNLVVIYIVGGIILTAMYAWTSPIMYRNAVIEKEKGEQEQSPVAASQNAPRVEEDKVAVQVEPEPKPVIVRSLPEEFWDEE